MYATITKTKEILDLRRLILSTETGVTLRDVQSIYGISRRTAERRLQAILNVDASVDKWKNKMMYMYDTERLEVMLMHKPRYSRVSDLLELLIKIESSNEGITIQFSKTRIELKIQSPLNNALQVSFNLLNVTQVLLLQKFQCLLKCTFCTFGFV